MKKKIRLLIGAAALLIVITISAIVYLRHKGFLLPGYVTWQERTLSSDGFDIILSKKHLKVYKESVLVWESDSSVKVQDVILTDVDRNGMTEMTVLCWKKGRFGRSKPFFEEDDTSVYSEHIYLYDLLDEKPGPKWMASDIGAIVLTLESPNGYILVTHEKEGGTSEWQWNGWGFTKVK